MADADPWTIERAKQPAQEHLLRIIDLERDEQRWIPLDVLSEGLDYELDGCTLIFPAGVDRTPAESAKLIALYDEALPRAIRRQEPSTAGSRSGDTLHCLYGARASAQCRTHFRRGDSVHPCRRWAFDMKPLGPLALEEVQNIVAEGDLDPEARLAQAAELRELRKLHAAAKTRTPIRVIRMAESLPDVGDLAAWKRLVREARAAAAATDGAPDLVSIANKGD